MEEELNLKNSSDEITEKLSGILQPSYNQDSSKLCFPSAPVWKIVYLSIISLGIYEMVYFCTLWKTLRDNFGYKVHAGARGVFAGITNFWLFPILEKYFKAFGEKAFIGILAAGLYFIINFSSRLPDFYSLISFGTIVFLVYIQIKINRINRNNFPDAPQNNWSTANTIWALLLTPLFLLCVLGIIVEFYDKQV